MKSANPKGLHPICGLPLVEHVGRAMRAIGIEKPTVVIGHGGDLLRAALGDEAYQYAYQTEQLGTGHAAMVALETLRKHRGPILVAPGDTPLLTPEVLGDLVSHHVETRSQATVATFDTSDPTGYGRIVRALDGSLQAIVEEKDADAATKALNEVNAAVYCFDCETLVRLLPTLRNDNAQAEYYLTDVISAVVAEGGIARAVRFGDSAAFLGINDRWQLAEAAAIMRQRILVRHALNGVSIEDPATTYIGADVEIGQDTTISPMTTIEGRSRIGSGCVVGPLSRVVDSRIEDECTVLMSNVNGALMGEGSRCGPYAHLRPGAQLGSRSKIGNFVEIKNAELGEGVAVSHLSYVGDARIGSRSNIGAGTITCNYDGFQKNRTEIGEGAFIGSNSTLIAPLTIGDNAFIAAGSTINRDVDAESLAIGRAKQEEKKQWVARWRQRKQTESK